MTRPTVVKREATWRWECRGTCPRGGAYYRTWRGALAALFRHLSEHDRFGFS